MEIEDIKKIIKNGGATLTKDLKKANLTNGYMVSLEGAESQVKSDDYQAIMKAIEEKQEIMQDRDNLYIGLWLDDNIVYVDISINIIDKVDALEFGKYNKQLAIYDLVNNDSIYLRDYNFIKYYSLYKVIRDRNGEIIDYQIREQRENINLFKSIKASTKSILNATYKSLDDAKNSCRMIENRYIVIKDYEVIL